MAPLPWNRQAHSQPPPLVGKTDGWITVATGGKRHVIPAFDTVKHETADPCPCSPETITPQWGLPVVLHSTICTPMPAGIPEDYE